MLPFAKNCPKTELKIFDGAKITIEGISSISSLSPMAPSGDTISRPDLHIAGGVKINIDHGNKVPANQTF